MKLTLPELLKSKRSGRCDALRNAMKHGQLNDPGLIPVLVDCLADRSNEIADFAADKVVPAIGKAAVPLIVHALNPMGAIADFRRLRALRSIDPSEARIQARLCLGGTHPKLVREAISALAGSVDDGDTLLQLTRRKSADHRYAAYSALQGIATDRVVKTISEDFKKGVDFVELAMAHTPHASYAGLCVESLKTLKATISIESALPKNGSERLKAAVSAARGQSGEELDSLLHDFIDFSINGSLARPESRLPEHDLIQHLLEAVAVNPSPKAQRRLVEHRDAFDSSFLIYPMCAASWHSDLSLFDIFSPYLVTQNDESRCRGWKCIWRGPWPCSILSAVEFALNEDFAAAGYSGTTPLPRQLQLIARIREDRRWISAAKAAATPKTRQIQKTDEI